MLDDIFKIHTTSVKRGWIDYWSLVILNKNINTFCFSLTYFSKSTLYLFVFE